MNIVNLAHGCLPDKQGALFLSAPMHDLPEGAQILYHFADASGQASLLCEIDAGTWLHDLRRRVQHYGYRYDYKARRVDPKMYLGTLPAWLDEWGERLVSQGLFAKRPDQVIVNEYQAGQGISPHIDCIACFHDMIASLSLGSSCVMDFTHSRHNEKRSVMLPEGSLLILSGEARYEWKHAIAARKSDVWQGSRYPRTRRLSLTFRNVIT